MTAPLEIIGHIPVPDIVMRHRFVKEALACARLMAKKVDDRESREQVVGTANTRQVELYGWAPNVDSHADKIGIVYLLALNDGKSTVNVMEGDDATCVWLPRGAVARLDDHVSHWTEDDQVRVCAFLGAFKEPCDADALAMLTDAVKALATNEYYRAPRVREGFRVLLADECLVMNRPGDGVDTMLLTDAIQNSRLVETCAKCGKPAVRVDDRYPYHTDMNRCREHMKED